MQATRVGGESGGVRLRLHGVRMAKQLWQQCVGMSGIAEYAKDVDRRKMCVPVAKIEARLQSISLSVNSVNAVCLIHSSPSIICPAPRIQFNPTLRKCLLKAIHWSRPKRIPLLSLLDASIGPSLLR